MTIIPRKKDSKSSKIIVELVIEERSFCLYMLIGVYAEIESLSNMCYLAWEEVLG